MRRIVLGLGLAAWLGCSGSADSDAFRGSTTSGTRATPRSSSGGGAGGAGSTSTSSSGSTATSSGTGAGGSGQGGSSTSTSSGAGGASSSSSGSGGGAGGGPALVAEVYAHSSATLFKLDPITKAVTTIGNFVNCNGSVIDIAIDKVGNMYGTMFTGLAIIDKSNAVCTVVQAGSYPNSLSFVPEGTVDPNEEALVGYNGSTYVRIDKVTGAISNIGNLGGGYVSSGDMVSLIGGGSYLTVNGNGCGDCIVEVNPTTGALVQMIGPLGYGSVFGLAYWGGVAYGFNNSGQLFQIDVGNGSTTPIPIPNAPPGLSFWGAGSTTAAPHM